MRGGVEDEDEPPVPPSVKTSAGMRALLEQDPYGAMCTVSFTDQARFVRMSAGARTVAVISRDELLLPVGNEPPRSCGRRSANSARTAWLAS